MADQGFDVVVVGAGPGGYVAAIRAALAATGNSGAFVFSAQAP